MRKLWLLALLLLAPAWGWEGTSRIPDRPPDQDLWDAAQVLTESDRHEVLQLQSLTRASYQVPIAVVTIHRMNDYVKQTMDIETFSQLWFDKWELGTTEENYGILVLVSLEDRQARIELGAGWRGLWNSQCNHIMQTEMVPRFRQGDYSLGILRGVEGLSEMAEQRDQPLSLERLGSSGTRLRYWVQEKGAVFKDVTWFPPEVAVLGLLLGALLLVAAAVVKPLRSPLAVLGVTCPCLLTFPYVTGAVIVIVVAGFVFYGLDRMGLLNNSSGYYGSSYSSSSFSSGGFSGGSSFSGGGFSGGGGATGSW